MISMPTELLVVWLVLLGISLMELPREIMLSSDPDLHAFWAQQISRIGEVPWNQGLWGSDRFAYPTGFAVLNYLWTAFSGLPVQVIVTAQPMIQAQLSLALLAWTAYHLCGGHDTSSRNGGYVLGFVLLMAMYYTFLPFGYQNNHFHLEGAGRLSATLLSATCLCFGVVFVKALLTSSVSVSDAARYMFFVGCSITLLGLINPSAVMIPSCFVACSVTAYLIFSRPQSVLSKSLALVVFSVPLIQLVFADPYYFDILTGLLDPASSDNPAVPTGMNLSGSLASNAESFIKEPVTAIGNFFTLDLLSAEATWRIFAGATAALALSWIWSWFRWKRIELTDLILFILIPVTWVLYSLLLVPAAQSLAAHPHGRLLSPYLTQSLQQNMFNLLGLVIAILITRISTLSRWWVSVFTVLALLHPMYKMSVSSAMVTVTPRYGYAGSMGDLTADDQRVIEYIEGFSRTTLAKYPHLNARTVPKILIPNDPIIINQEHWLFSFGGSRVLPLRDTLPVAFFYSQGDPKLFSWDAYKKYVCQGLNRSWMATKNIRYVFIPSQIAGSCAAALRRQVHPDDVIFQSGDAMFAKILPRREASIDPVAHLGTSVRLGQSK